MLARPTERGAGLGSSVSAAEARAVEAADAGERVAQVQGVRRKERRAHVTSASVLFER